MATYRRAAAEDVEEVEFIVSLIDEHVAQNFTKWSEAKDVKTTMSRLLTQKKWQGILASLKSEEPEPPADRVGSFGTRGEAPQLKPKSTRGGDAKPKDATE